MSAVKCLVQSDITKIFLFFILTVVSAAIISPGLYNVGMFLAEVGESHELNGAMNWLARQSASAVFPGYFNLSLVVCGLLLAGPFIMWLNLENPARQPLASPWQIRLPKHTIAHDGSHKLRHNTHASLHLATGFLLTGGILTLAVWALLVIDWFSLDHPVQWWYATRTALITAIMLAVVKEWLFRGVLLGIFLRALHPAAAITMVSLIYALIHFFLPTGAIQVDDPCSADAGFEMLSLVGQHLINPREFAFGFVSLTAIGLILAYARYRTASLWLPIGLHIGWIFSHRSLQQITEFNPDHPPLSRLVLGPDGISGLLPLCLLIITGLLVHVFVQISDEKRRSQA